MKISLIAAMTSDKVIGINNTIPWFLASDLAWFKYHALNKPIIMGRITYESIGKCPLPQRLNIILSHKKNNKNAKNLIWVNSVQEALKSTGKAEEVMIIGGGKIYELFLPLANRLYLTHIDAKVIGDTYFPIYESYKWNVVFTEYHLADLKNSYNYRFEILERCIVS
ncbi:type 3 dihydrofolate reductase [Arsenophonus symbiont of Ornithomya chloropus]|uniref:type 3 dihydrofolate reductase n=1 Tax=Arsenophonus symbiont of Ornithomya chloropus TaxID=634121 RepID=UPI0032B0F194